MHTGKRQAWEQNRIDGPFLFVLEATAEKGEEQTTENDFFHARDHQIVQEQQDYARDVVRNDEWTGKERAVEEIAEARKQKRNPKKGISSKAIQADVLAILFP